MKIEKMYGFRITVVIFVIFLNSEVFTIEQKDEVKVKEDETSDRSKRYNIGLQTCIDNFDIHTDKIIRTQDSRAMGAKYLNEVDVNSREECLKLCCETDTCDVFVFEERIAGSCYLFHCGTPEDFKCKFTQHRNYTSAVLTLNTHLNELENQIKLTKHEKELTRLRKPDVPVETTSQPNIVTTLKVPQPQLGAEAVKNGTVDKSQCSRYQFECKSTGECIAIYNACDGVPQCADGSDEAQELDCPTIFSVAGTSQPKPLTIQQSIQKTATENQPVHPVVSNDETRPENHKEIISYGAGNTPQQYKPPTAVSWQQHQQPLHQQPQLAVNYQNYRQPTANGKIPEFPTSQQKSDQQQQLTQQSRIYGREGEGIGQVYPNNGIPWQGYQEQFRRPDEGSHIFTHKGNGLISESTDSQTPVQYSNEMSHADYLKYAAGNNGYYGGNGPYYYPVPNAWNQQRHGNDEFQQQQRPNFGPYMGQGLPDYYYEDSQGRSRGQPQTEQKEHEPNNFPDNGMFKQAHKAKEAEKQETVESSLQKIKEDPPKNTESVKKTLKETEHKGNSDKEVTTSKPRLDKKHNENHVKSEQLTMNEDDYVTRQKMEGKSDRPSGAILSLTLGMCITAIMITLVGCRLRVVRRRMRRGGKSPYAHDADFLVNGMYL